MPHNLVHFVLLQFSPRSRQETVNILLVDLENGNPLRISIDPAWEERVDSDDREYLSALIDDWRNTPPERIQDLIHELCRLSSGPLRLIQEKRATLAQAMSLLKPDN
jgi:hypothetical protein